MSGITADCLLFAVIRLDHTNPSILSHFVRGALTPYMVVLGVPKVATMSDDMGTFRIDVEVARPDRQDQGATVRSVLVDTGAELSWFPAQMLEELGIRRLKQWHFRQADGSILTRWAGAAIVRVAGVSCGDEVVFGEPADLILLGARSLEGLNLRVDPRSKTLVDAGPAPAAAA
jgi:predicted aspartyl protease